MFATSTISLFQRAAFRLNDIPGSHEGRCLTGGNQKVHERQIRCHPQMMYGRTVMLTDWKEIYEKGSRGDSLGESLNGSLNELNQRVVLAMCSVSEHEQ